MSALTLARLGPSAPHPLFLEHLHVCAQRALAWVRRLHADSADERAAQDEALARLDARLDALQGQLTEPPPLDRLLELAGLDAEQTTLFLLSLGAELWPEPFGALLAALSRQSEVRRVGALLAALYPDLGQRLAARRHVAPSAPLVRLGLWSVAQPEVSEPSLEQARWEVPPHLVSWLLGERGVPPWCAGFASWERPAGSLQRLVLPARGGAAAVLVGGPQPSRTARVGGGQRPEREREDGLGAGLGGRARGRGLARLAGLGVGADAAQGVGGGVAAARGAGALLGGGVVARRRGRGDGTSAQRPASVAARSRGAALVGRGLRATRGVVGRGVGAAVRRLGAAVVARRGSAVAAVGGGAVGRPLRSWGAWRGWIWRCWRGATASTAARSAGRCGQRWT